jgi:hypothetical protein
LIRTYVDLTPGSLVVRKQRWHVDANLMGIVIGQENDSWLVLWTTGDRRSEFKWHVGDALLVIDPLNVPQVAVRRDFRP